MEHIDVVLDLQYGSTGKGLLVGWLAQAPQVRHGRDGLGAKRGHTLIDDTGRKFVHTQLALGIVSPLCKRVLLGPGSVIDPVKLLDEIAGCADLIAANDIRIAIHPHAAVVQDGHREEEAQTRTNRSYS
jgi:adenylosuccinate synthase